MAAIGGTTYLMVLTVNAAGAVVSGNVSAAPEALLWTTLMCSMLACAVVLAGHLAPAPETVS